MFLEEIGDGLMRIVSIIHKAEVVEEAVDHACVVFGDGGVACRAEGVGVFNAFIV